MKSLRLRAILKSEKMKKIKSKPYDEFWYNEKTAFHLNLAKSNYNYTVKTLGKKVASISLNEALKGNFLYDYEILKMLEDKK